MIDLSWIREWLSDTDDRLRQDKQACVDNLLYLWVDHEQTVDYTPDMLETFFATYIIERERREPIWDYELYPVDGVGGSQYDGFDPNREHTVPAPFARAVRHVHDEFVVNPSQDVPDYEFMIEARQRRDELSSRSFYQTLPQVLAYVRDREKKTLYHVCERHSKKGVWSADLVEFYE